MTPRGLASPLRSLPPILDNVPQTPTSSCSKGSRGLSVQPRVLGIFTETTVSPDPSKRQRPSRYAIRAGRNLPDKEFRYLRHRCYSAMQLAAAAWSGHFCLTPHVAVRIGLSHHAKTRAWRTVSEDPALSGFLLIVRTGRIVTARLSTNEYRRILGYSSI